MAEHTFPEVNELLSRLKLLLPPLLGTQRASWEQGHAAQALLECHHLFLDNKLSPSALPYDLLQCIYAFAHDAIVRQGPDGRLSVLLNGDGASDPGAADPACIGESLYFLVQHTAGESPSMRESAEKMLCFILDKCPRKLVGEGAYAHEYLFSHRVDAIQIWSDTVYMVAPFLVSAAIFYLANPSPLFLARDLLTMGLRQVELAARVLQSPGGEWSHIFDLSKRELQREAFWGVGNGWAAGGIVRIFHMLLRTPGVEKLFEDDYEENLTLLLKTYGILLTTINGCMRHRRADGLFHDVLDDPTTFVETNLAQQLAYVLFCLLDLYRCIGRPRWMVFPPPGDAQLDKWEEWAHSLREAAVRKTDRWGFVRDVCGSPSFDKPGTAAEGQAWAVLMEVARADYLTHKGVKEQRL